MRHPSLGTTVGLLWLLGACGPDEDFVPGDHGEIAEGAVGRMGDPVGWATDADREVFERGRALMEHRFSLAEGLGPAFNVTFCGACHEKPVFGGSAGLYRNFFLSQVRTDDGAQFPGRSAGDAGGVIRLYHYGDDEYARPTVPAASNVIAQRNPIPFFGVGLLAELSEGEILRRADPDDLDGDGISGRPNYDRGFVGRFGRKAQTVSIEGFIRGPIFNHLGITTDPLTDEQKAALPVDSASTDGVVGWLRRGLVAHGQAAAPDGPLTDDDGVPDPEMSTDDLFDLVSFSMLLAAPSPEPLDGDVADGAVQFDLIGCRGCHTPRLEGPRGPLPVYSDLLLHDMGEALADGLVQGEATGSEFRTQPLWGLAATGPYLHDGRAMTLDEAVRAHGGEADASRMAYEALSDEDRETVLRFLASLGGQDQASLGLLPPDEVVPDAGDWGGPLVGLEPSDLAAFEAGRVLFDREFGLGDGVGEPRYNGDSCRACHFEPVVGGAGPRGVNVTRHGILNGAGEFALPAVGSILHRSTSWLTGVANRAQDDANVFEHRQTPHLFGLGLIDALDEAEIVSRADPTDANADGISGRVSWTDGDRVGRFGWKAQVPSLAEFVRDAVGAELGMTLPAQEGLTFGAIQDDDDVADPEMSVAEAESLLAYLAGLAPPPRGSLSTSDAALRGETLFGAVGCAACHVPSLTGPDVDVPLYSDLLLHEVLSVDQPGTEEAGATQRELRTPPLWGVSRTGPWLHDGSADTLAQALDAHDGEAAAARDAWAALATSERADLLLFLESL